MICNRGTGWRRQSLDHRDHKYSMIPCETDVSGVSYDLRAKMPPVVDQGRANSCCACAVAGVMQYLRKIGGQSPDWPLSRLFVYWCGRELEGETGIDNGLEIRDAIKAVAKFGICPEDVWPYRSTLIRKRPYPRAYMEAKKDILLKYEAIPQRMTHILSCLKRELPVIFGASVFKEIESDEVRRTGVVPLPAHDERPAGSHCMAIVGYQAREKRFVVRNSWGTHGDHGHLYMDQVYLLDPDLASDFWVCSVVS